MCRGYRIVAVEAVGDAVCEGGHWRVEMLYEQRIAQYTQIRLSAAGAQDNRTRKGNRWMVWFVRGPGAASLPTLASWWRRVTATAHHAPNPIGALRHSYPTLNVRGSPA